MDAIKMLKTRQSQRDYEEYSIDLKIIEDIIDCARLAPSARNYQPLRYVIIDDKKIIKDLSKNIANAKFFDKAPIVIAVFAESDAKFKLEDGSAATENILLGATAYKLGSCWVAGYQKDYHTYVEKLLQCPKEYELISLISIGKVKNPTTRPQKKDLGSIISYNKFE